VSAAIEGSLNLSCITREVYREGRSACDDEPLHTRRWRVLGHVVQPQSIHRIDHARRVPGNRAHDDREPGWPDEPVDTGNSHIDAGAARRAAPPAREAAFVLAAAALGLLVVSTAITLSVNVPIDGQIAGWTIETLPADWEHIRNRWEFYHGLRTALTLVGAACLFASALWTHRGQTDMQRAALRPA
jgi:hypothetical protein